MRHLQQVPTQVGEHRHPQLHTADLLSQTQVGQAVPRAELLRQDLEALCEEGLSQEIAADLQRESEWQVGLVLDRQKTTQSYEGYIPGCVRPALPEGLETRHGRRTPGYCRRWMRTRGQGG